MSHRVTRELRREFERFAAKNGLDLTSGLYGELLSAETRKYWLAYNTAWRRGRVLLKKSSARKADNG